MRQPGQLIMKGKQLLGTQVSVKVKALRHITDKPADGQGIGIFPVNENLSGIRINEAQQAAHKGRFTGTVWSDNADGLAWFNAERQPIESNHRLLAKE